MAYVPALSVSSEARVNPVVSKCFPVASDSTLAISVIPSLRRVSPTSESTTKELTNVPAFIDHFRRKDQMEMFLNLSDDVMQKRLGVLR